MSTAQRKTQEGDTGQKLEADSEFFWMSIFGNPDGATLVG